ncbi:flagellar export protein FliJ [Lysobacter korlensis]|uniref:Flagellar FliJ protein n=1 Tax=Lysobacter korlensis TaxID=553636 RepID=A0ABV6RJA8_9GAMM
MTRSQRLDPLLRIKQQRQDEAARQVAERDRALAEQQDRLETLRRYADEYAIAPANATIAPALLANRLAFREKLDAAVQQQVSIVHHTRQSAEVERARLMLASRDTKVLEQLAASYRAEEGRLAEKRTQRELDDLGGRRARAAQVAADEGDTA